MPVSNRRGGDSQVGFPDAKPSCGAYKHGWFLDTHKRVFGQLLHDDDGKPNTEIKTILEVGLLRVIVCRARCWSRVVLRIMMPRCIILVARARRSIDRSILSSSARGIYS